MNSAYFETRFRTSQAVHEWPREFVIISAFATTGETWTPDQNAAADRLLEAELKARDGWVVRIVGYSPTTDHAEPSWAVTMPVDEACAMGRRFRQDAIYHVLDDVLSVTYCAGHAALVVVGSFRSRLDSHRFEMPRMGSS